MPIPDEQAFQIFYGTIPLIAVVLGGFLRAQLLLKDILARLGRIEGEVGQVKERLVKLETRAGIVFTGSGD